MIFLGTRNNERHQIRQALRKKEGGKIIKRSNILGVVVHIKAPRCGAASMTRRKIDRSIWRRGYGLWIGCIVSKTAMGCVTTWVVMW